MLPTERRLDEHLPPALRPRLAAALAAVGVADAPAQRMQPWLLGTLMTLQAARLAGFHTEQGVDLWLATEARARGLPLVALETVERQIAAVSGGCMTKRDRRSCGQGSQARRRMPGGEWGDSTPARAGGASAHGFRLAGKAGAEGAGGVERSSNCQECCGHGSYDVFRYDE